MTYTRKQYLNQECTHHEYYAQFVDANMIARVGDISLEEPLPVWDGLPPLPHYIGDKMREAGDYPTLAGNVCIHKEAARQRDDHSHKTKAIKAYAATYK